jgi:RNA-dependent RNA polymerase
VFKDGGKEEKKKDPTTSPVKCFFVCMESVASVDNQDNILCGKTIRQARSVFMHVDNLSSLSNYMARLVTL